MNINLSEIFHSIQGESTYAGRPCVFVRFAECNLRCSWCDSKFSFKTAFEMPVRDVVRIVEGFDCRLVEITGGEPLLQREAVNELAGILLAREHEVLLETVLSLPMSDIDPRIVKIIDIKCPGSRMSAQMDWSQLRFLHASDQFKFVVQDREDFDWAVRTLKEHPIMLRNECLFSPVTGKLDPHDLAEWILKSGLRIRFQMQVHKALRTEATEDDLGAHLMRMNIDHPAILEAQARYRE